MTSRLKKKLGNLGIEARTTESFCLIGTPLPPLEKPKDTGEFVPLWKQEVRDEKGRRRLHGAFTGGFSAGYFNTVGSKEGWTPSTFVSSRSDRAKKAQARPEDFMDEEDMQDIRDSQQLVHNADEMDLTRRANASVPFDENDDIANAVANSLAPPPKDSAGAKILKKMGWRLGQGIGPRLSWAQRRAQDIAAGVPASTLPDANDEEACKHSYAPRDTPVVLSERKENSHGLGYKSAMGLQEATRAGSQNKGPNISAGFGLGALNDADEDDLDVYDRTASASQRTAYDITDAAEEDRISITTKAERTSKPAPALPGSRQVFSNGSLVLSEFVLSDKPVAEDKWFPIPDIPAGWTPDPTRVWRQDPNKENQGRLSHETLQKNWREGISADERGKMLGEAQLKAEPRSVFDYMSQKDRERIQNIATGGTTLSIGPEPTLYIPPVDSNVAQAALTGFQPYQNDLDKQARYLLYLQYHVNPDNAPQPTKLPDQTTEQFNKEMEDYKKSATLFKPMSGVMAGRFTSAAVVEHGPKVQEGLHTPSTSSTPFVQPTEEEPKKERELSPKEHAAKMGMYGHMTRETSVWIPARLLCKRFGVKEPNPVVNEEEPTEAPSATPNTDAFVSQAMLTIGAGDPEETKSGRRDLANVGMGDDETQGKDILTYERPSMDIFKAIFASDDEDEEGDTEEPMQVDEVKTTPPVPPTTKSAESEPVDLNTFKPTFVPRVKGKEKEDGEDNKASKKRKKKEKVLVSFDVDDGGMGLDIQPKKRKKEKKKKKDEDEDEWVEKPPPQVVMKEPVVPVANQDTGDNKVAGPARARKRAVDFM